MAATRDLVVSLSCTVIREKSLEGTTDRRETQDCSVLEMRASSSRSPQARKVKESKVFVIKRRGKGVLL